MRPYHHLAHCWLQTQDAKTQTEVGKIIGFGFHCSQLDQKFDGIGDRLEMRRCKSPGKEGRDTVLILRAAGSKAELLALEAHLFEWSSEQLTFEERSKRRMAPARKEMEAHACFRSSGPPFSLLCRCLADPYGLKGGSFKVGVVVLLLCPSRVDNKGDVVDCDARFGNVGRKYDLSYPLWWPHEYLSLIFGRNTGMQRKDGIFALVVEGMGALKKKTDLGNLRPTW
mmetsp:Transcript_21215/g.60880  ORF Transcript_21215/g.60880 Transcript_21215/m.60880 type:complete len:226 (-) Transcript_21215:1591-2268(-)